MDFPLEDSFMEFRHLPMDFLGSVRELLGGHLRVTLRRPMCTYLEELLPFIQAAQESIGYQDAGCEIVGSLLIHERLP